MRRPSVDTIVLIALVPVLLALVGNVATGTVDADEYKPWVWVVTGLLVVAAVVIEVRRHRSDGQTPQERSTHNQANGTVHGSVIQAGTIHCSVTVIGPSGPMLRDALAETADQLAQAVRTRWQREEEHRQIQDPFPLP